MSRKPKKKVLVKMIIIGDSGVGKTAILHQYVMEKFEGDYKATIGADFLSKDVQIDDKSVTLQMWDTAGQERFQSLGNSFYRGADACILVFDITDEASFKSIDSWRSKFVQQANIDNPRKFPFLLLGNKSDLDNQRAVSHNQGEMYARDNMMEFAETSALRNTNIDRAIQNLADIAADSDTVPFFTEDLVERINLENDGGRGDNFRQQPAGCACTLL
mmetsp:Transcript_20491/g.32799  ORF Transcript_20491/g.32799 Transcript_20491/m.32799 type:complete len:217 (+) Transcript_20491:94-744(+)|eukprot:CAMPEP_0202712046 /NCGR_PEP_ID=MMETSP1385-20130828/31842_1 /ASSEMBLY_ACC=CAM_ASM_000861 /TAXON_ID=933848 /ORGANISM="Elphidium margaritaceum" /LENGTH=216 /DNA_ID=CAMNT_0049371953 /DNA_START=53 /DNA_END=703 /DNA_ORIENTATION=+